jgi:hypothetical protein
MKLFAMQGDSFDKLTKPQHSTDQGMKNKNEEQSELQLLYQT